MKKTFSSLLALFILLQSQAYGGSASLKSILDEYSYSVEVDWDQVDSEVLRTHQQKLEASLKAYLEEQELEAVIDELMMSIEDPAIQEQVKQSIINAPDADALRNNLLTIYEQSKNQGAQWSSVGKVALGAVGVLALTYLAFRIYMHEWGKRL